MSDALLAEIGFDNHFPAMAKPQAPTALDHLIRATRLHGQAYAEEGNYYAARALGKTDQETAEFYRAMAATYYDRATAMELRA